MFIYNVIYTLKPSIFCAYWKDLYIPFLVSYYSAIPIE